MGLASLKGETLGLAISLELPLVVIDIQRGPSTGLPTKTEAADLMMAMYGRHGKRRCRLWRPVLHRTASTPQSKRCALPSVHPGHVVE